MKEVINWLTADFGNFLWSYVLIIMLIGLGLYFTVRTKFVQIRMIGEMFRLLGEGAVKKKGVSSFQAFCISTASRVGTGNLAGVAIAISLGGPGAVFWMWLIALIGSASAFVESTLAQIYKVEDKKTGTFRGGPAYYMEKALNARWMGILFAIMVSISFGLAFNSVQANTITNAFHHAFGFDMYWTGLGITAVAAFIIFGGIKRIVKAAEWMVPPMAGMYILLAVYVMAKNFGELPQVFSLIFQNAFGLNEAVGGGFGAAMMMGIKRGLFSNEAGMGSAPIAAATADVSHPVKQGLIQSLGVFVDTMVICSSTAFIILLSGVYTSSESNGIVLTQSALNAEIGPWATIFIAILILMFAFSSIVGNYYYGESNISFIKSGKVWLTLYRLAVIGMVAFGSLASLDIVWGLADVFMGIMAVINLVAIALLGKIAFAALNDYRKQKQAGKNPVFSVSNIEGLKNVEYWEADKQPALKKEA
ncbi:alanine/glycine:cation symporter family protein [Cytobacillus oceanisediminis]|uniref:alanine/glycine:cation symporter family protein n=1 Tax=Cytobacillus oceanisediminis TaxID=665099 RepID=UPI0023DB5207|nr:alanine/glycine:cation symporter family protein [Cytobacillus oceanisediminis]MDF2037626.1 alanine/glycine:cation symporter family protein [Cytobacillus oceanisediminis]